MIPRFKTISHGTLLLISYLATIFTGALLLYLPFSTASGQIGLIDSLFTATSAVCVTGLIVVDTGGYFTLTGQLVILTLIQLGGLGIMTISVSLFLFMGRRVPLKHRLAMQDVFAHSPRRDIYDLVKSVLIFTFIVETLGTAFLFAHFYGEHSASRALYLAVFHSISAFCNAGFSLFADSFMAHRGSVLLNLTVCALIVLGGIGFPVVYEIYLRIRRRHVNGRLSVHTKVVLLTTLALILSGILLFAFAERGRLPLSPWSAEYWLAALFQSITARTAGFNTVDIASLSTSTLAFLIFLMFFGASPGSCGGGVKTTTLAMLGLYSITRLKGQQHLNIFKKTIPKDITGRSISLFVLSVVIVSMVLFGVLLLEEGSGHRLEAGRAFLAHLFEVVSAFGTVGLSMGVTSGLSGGAKCLIIALMLIGRLGVPTFAYLLVGGANGNHGIEYAEEKLMVG